MENTSELTTEKVFNRVPLLEEMTCQTCIYSRPQFIRDTEHTEHPTLGYICIYFPPVLLPLETNGDCDVMSSRGCCGQGKWGQYIKDGYIRMWTYDSLWEHHTNISYERNLHENKR